MRNPKWKRDEILLALDLYFKIEPGQIHARNPEIISLSEILNKLPIHTVRPDKIKFRNPNGVGLKLSNFLALDPNYEGKGMNSFSKLDQEIFEEFYPVKKRGELKVLAAKIRESVSKEDFREKLYQIGDEDEERGVKEGSVLYRLHKYKERNSKIVKIKKEKTLKKYGRLVCEVCEFDFHEFYGELGEGFIECHHIEPLSSIELEKETKLKDLALVCSNCHRMLHRKISTLSVKNLKSIIKHKTL